MKKGRKPEQVMRAAHECLKGKKTIEQVAAEFHVDAEVLPYWIERLREIRTEVETRETQEQARKAMDTEVKEYDTLYHAACHYLDQKGQKTYVQVADEFQVNENSLRARVSRLRVLRIQ